MGDTCHYCGHEPDCAPLFCPTCRSRWFAAPSLDEIRAACGRIQDDWSDSVECSRRTGHRSEPVEISVARRVNNGRVTREGRGD